MIIPVWRNAFLAEKAILSAASQTHRPAEIIVIDDCSGDDTVIRLRQAATRLPSIEYKLIELRKNVGPGEARNAGWDAASGEFIAFLDADDFWHPDKLRFQINVFRRHPELALLGTGVMVNNLEETSPICGSGDVEIVSLRKQLFRNRFSTPSVMLRRVVRSRFRVGKRFSEDFLLWCDILFEGHTAAKVRLPLTFLRKERFGESGLSSKMTAMFAGESEAYRVLRVEDKLSFLTYATLQAISLLAFVRRILIVVLKRAKVGRITW